MNTLRKQIESVESQIAEVEKEIEALQNEIDSFEYSISESDFDEMLDCEGEQHTSVGSFYPSDILKNCDPTAYRIYKSEYESSFNLDDCEEYTDLKDELELLENDLESLNDELDELNDQLDDN